ncbi:hypothetical protein [uncultured Thiodictyon sp.]
MRVTDLAEFLDRERDRAKADWRKRQVA